MAEAAGAGSDRDRLLGVGRREEDLEQEDRVVREEQVERRTRVL